MKRTITLLSIFLFTIIHKVNAGEKFVSPGILMTNPSETRDNELSHEIIGNTFYPNPVHDKAMLIVTTKTRLHNPELKIFDVQSKLVAEIPGEKMSDNNSIEFFIDCSQFSKGEYHYMLTENEMNILSDHFMVR